MQNYCRLLFNKISIVLLLTVSLSTTVNAKPKQQILLDSNGNPYSNELLLAITSGNFSKNKKKASHSNRRANKKRSSTARGKQQVARLQKKQKPKPPVSTPEREKELLDALLTGQTAKASHLIRSGVKVNYENYKGETPLSIAVDRGWASMVVDLIEHGGRLRQKNSLGLSLLHRATAKGYTDLAKVLIKHGLNPSSTTTKDWNSLHIAARYGHWQLVQLYLNMGVNPNERTSDGKAALEIAQIVHHPGIVKALSRATTARPIGRAANYDRRNNRQKYDELEAFKKAKVARKRAQLHEIESIRQAKLAHKRAILKEKGAIRWRQKNGKCGPNNIYCIPKLTEE